jgi:signal transduction histidine kinase
MHLMVCDNGHGFPFYGHYDLAASTALSLGSRMLWERVASLRGGLTIDSTAAGACLLLTVPLGQPGV